MMKNKALMLSKLSSIIKEKTPIQLKKYMNSFKNSEMKDENEEDSLVPENYHYYDSQKNDQQDDDELVKKMRFQKYRNA